MRMLALVALVALAAPAGATTIADLVATPAGYKDQTVTVEGTVASPDVGYAGESAYTLQDGDLRLSIFSRNEPPVAGTRLSVTGRVGYKAPDDEFTWPPVLMESARQPARP
jgi:hypothetical protein